MNFLPRKKIVLLGMMARMPVAGVVWQTVQYLVGFQRLGYDAYYVEAHATSPTMFLDEDDHDGSDKVAAFLDRVLRRFDFGDRWAFHARTRRRQELRLKQDNSRTSTTRPDGSSTSMAGPCRCPSTARRTG